MISRVDTLLVVFSAIILGVLVYVPVISYSPSLSSLPNIGGIMIPAPHANSITLQFFNFGGQVESMNNAFSTYIFCSTWTCGSIWPVGVVYAILVALMAIDVGLVARFLSNRSGIRGASAQIGIGLLALLSPLLPLNSLLLKEEVLVAGVVLILTGIAELWWFRANENYAHRLKAEEQISFTLS